MEPPNKIQKKLTKAQILADAITTKLCAKIDSGVYQYGGVCLTFEFDKEFKNLKKEHVIKIINHLQQSAIITTLIIFHLNNDDIKYLLTQLITNVSVNNLIFDNLDFNTQNYFDEFKTLLSIPNKITNLSIKKIIDDQNQNFPLLQFINAIQSSHLVKLELQLNNLTFAQHIEIIKVLPQSLKILYVSFENEKQIFSTMKLDICNQLVLEFANQIQKTNLEALNINYHLFSFLQSCIIVHKLPKTLKKFTYGIRNNNFMKKNLFKEMSKFSDLIYNNFNLTEVNINFGYEGNPEHLLIPYYNLNEIFVSNNALYNKIIKTVNLLKLTISTVSELLVKRNQTIPLNNENILTMILCVNTVNKQKEKSTQFSYLPIEILNLVNTFVYHKSIADIKDQKLAILYHKCDTTRSFGLSHHKKMYDDMNEFANRLVKRKLLERAAEQRNLSIVNYNQGLAQVQENYISSLNRIHIIKTIFKKRY